MIKSNVLAERELFKAKTLLSKATMTGKRQITIPKEIADLYKLKNGERIVFRNIEGNILIEPEGYSSECIVCHGTTILDGKDCFVCRGKGFIENEVLNSYMRLMGYICFAAFKNKIYMEYGYVNETYPFPLIKMNCESYSKETIDKVRDMLQLGIVQEFIGETSVYLDKDYLPIFTKKLNDVFITEEYKEKAKKWIESF